MKAANATYALEETAKATAITNAVAAAKQKLATDITGAKQKWTSQKTLFDAAQKKFELARLSTDVTVKATAAAL